MIEKIIKTLIITLSLAFGLFLEETKFIYIGIFIYFLVSVFFNIKNKSNF